MYLTSKKFFDRRFTAQKLMQIQFFALLTLLVALRSIIAQIE